MDLNRQEDDNEDDEADDDDDDDDDNDDHDDDDDDSTHTKLHAAYILSCTYSKRHIVHPVEAVFLSKHPRIWS
jgi:hypothetical protein